MTNPQKAATKTTGRNGDRSNGKKWGRYSPKASHHGGAGHRSWGRTKPSGNSVRGMKKTTAELVTAA